MYIRVYNDELIRVYTGEDLYSSEVIGKIKGKNPAAFTIRDKKNEIVFHDINKITAKELQMIIRNSDVTTIAITLSKEEILDYFYVVAKVELVEHNRESYTEEELFSWMNESIDSGIMHSSIWDEIKDEVLTMLTTSGFELLPK